MSSIWTNGFELPHFKGLKGNLKTDVLIIGGGITGILCAYFLRKQGVPYVLAEGKTICCGITGNTTAKITSQHGLLYHKLLKEAGREKAGMYLEANQKAVQKYSGLCSSLDCDFESKTAYVYALSSRKKLEQEADALKSLGFSCEISETDELPFPTAGAIGFKQQAQFHPLKFAAGIASGLNIFEHTPVKAVSGNTAFTETGQVTFKKCIFAAHFPIDNRHGMYFLKMYQHRSYVIALKHAAQVHGMYVDEAMCGMSFRNYKDILLIGGGDHRTGKKGGGWEELRAFAGKYYPNAQEVGHWAAQDCMTLDSIPYIGPYSRQTPEYFVASGFNKWGITSAMVSAMILSDLAAGRKNPYAAVFSPSRSMVKPQLLLNGLEAAKGLLTPSFRRCSHLGCTLRWNKAEHTWDCPCHGSRFDETGSVLDNPAAADLKQ